MRVLLCSLHHPTGWICGLAASHLEEGEKKGPENAALQTSYYAYKPRPTRETNSKQPTTPST